jgi:hypothetical protein
VPRTDNSQNYIPVSRIHWFEQRANKLEPRKKPPMKRAEYNEPEEFHFHTENQSIKSRFKNESFEFS